MSDQGKSETTKLSADEANAIEALRYRVNEAIIAEINDKRTGPDERTGLRLARIILNREAEAMNVRE